MGRGGFNSFTGISRPASITAGPLGMASMKAALAAPAPRTGLFKVHRFHHLELWAGDATAAYKRFQAGLGLTLAAKSDITTGNALCASYVLRSEDLVVAFTAPYSRHAPRPAGAGAGGALPGYSPEFAHEFTCKHGLAVRAIGLLVDDAAAAYAAATAGGAVGILAPAKMADAGTAGAGGSFVISEVAMMGDVVLRFVSGDYQGAFLPGYTATPGAPRVSYGLHRLARVAASTMSLPKSAAYIMAMTGFHTPACAAGGAPGSKVLADDDENVQLALSEPVCGAKSEAQTFLEHFEGPGVQCVAFEAADIFATLRQMRAAVGGFDFAAPPPPAYYRALPSRIGGALTPEQYAAAEELGVLVERTAQGVVLQAFTQPLGDRPTGCISIVQRIGGAGAAPASDGPAPYEVSSDEDEMDCERL